MSGHRKIEDRIKKKEAEIQELELKIREARAYVQAMQEAMKLLPRDSDVPAETVLRPGSAVARARGAIVGAGRALHVSELLEALGLDVNRKTRATLSGSISAYVRRGEIFSRPAPNTFGLIELDGQASKGDEGGGIGTERRERTAEPPPNFGAGDDVGLG